MTSAEWLQAQYSVLGAALIEPGLVPKVMAQTSEADFSGGCRTVYNTMRKLFLNEGMVDVVAVSSALGKNYREFLAQLIQVVPSAANIDSYISLCKEQARVLAVQDIARNITEADTSEKIRKLLADANGAMVEKKSLKITTMGDGLRAFMEKPPETLRYLTWPIRELDDYIFVRMGDFLVIAGYPSAGKSAWALQCAWHWAKNYKVGFFSLETSSEKLFDRLIAGVAGIDMGQIKRNALPQEGWDKVCRMTTEITTRNLELVPAAGMTPADVRAVTMMRGYQIIFVDYLQLLQGSGANRTEQVTGISMALHTMAQSMGVAVVALSQLKRKNPGEKSPDMSDLRESGQIEQDADLIQILYLKDDNDPNGDRVLKVSKNKDGVRARVYLDFDGAHQTFSKAKRTGDLLSKFVADGKKAKQRSSSPDATAGQMTMLPDDTPVPFH